MSEEKIVIAAKEPQQEVTILHGNRIIELKDESRISYRTNDLNSFVEYKMSHPLLSAQPTYVSYSASGADANVYNPEESANRHFSPAATVGLPIGDMLKRLIDMNAKWLPVKNGEEYVKQFLDGSTNDVAVAQMISFFRDCGFTAITSFEHERDSYGNYTCSVKRTGGEFKKAFPPKVRFIVPLWDDDDDAKIEIVADTYLDYKEEDKKVSVIWKIEVVNLNKQIARAMKVDLNARIPGTMYFGDLELSRLDNRDMLIVK